MFSDGTLWLGARSCPSGIHWFAAAAKRLAKMLVLPPGRLSLGSYQAVHGTERPVPAKSIEGASASLLRSMLSDWPCVLHTPFLNARTKICCSPLVFCSNPAHGTRMPPAAREPPTTSETPASSLGSMPAATSSLTWAPAGSCWREAPAVAARPSVVSATAPSVAPCLMLRRMGPPGKWDLSPRQTLGRAGDSRLRVVVEQRAQLVRLRDRAPAREALAHVGGRPAVDRVAALQQRHAVGAAGEHDVGPERLADDLLERGAVVADERHLAHVGEQEVDHLQQVAERGRMLAGQRV